MGDNGRVKVCVVGAGAAGMAAAWSLSLHPEKFDVHVWEKANIAGGVATSENVGCQDDWINDGVQGGAPTYRNTLLFHQKFGFEPTPVNLRVSFGKGTTAWNNVTETELVRTHRASIRRFGQVLQWIHRLEFIFAFLPISLVLSLFRFPKDFAAHMVYPLTALFFGTGNQTPSVSSAVIARVFLDPDLRLFDYDPERLLSQSPAMFSFGSLKKIYTTIATRLAATVSFSWNRPIAQIKRLPNAVYLVDDQGVEERFDHVVLATDAETALKSLEHPSFWERWTLGNVRYFNDVTITHTDTKYMQALYDVDSQRGDQYYVRSDEADAEQIEMSFNLKNYQPQLKTDVFQTIFLDDSRKQSWSIDKIDQSKVLLTKWWRQFSHTWRHFAFTVPFVRLIQGRQRTWYAGGYTMFNTHEMAVMSGLAVASRLGAPYPFTHDTLATKQFDQLLSLSHGTSRGSAHA